MTTNAESRIGYGERMNKKTKEVSLKDFLSQQEKLFDEGDKSEAEKATRDLLDQLEESLVDSAYKIARASCTLAHFHRSQGNIDNARSLLERANIILDNEPDDDLELSIRILCDLANLECEQGKFEKAIEYKQKSISQQIDLYGEQTLEVAKAQSELANYYMVLKNYEQAKELYLKSQQTKEALLGMNNLEIAASYAELSLLDYMIGNYAQSEEKIKTAVDIRTEIMGENNVKTGSYYNLMGLAMCAQGKHDQARPYCQRAITIREDNKFSDTASYLSELADVYCGNERFNEASQLCQEALYMRENSLGREDQDLADKLTTYAFILKETEREVEAELILNRIAVIKANQG